MAEAETTHGVQGEAHDEAHAGVHRHPAPTNFIRKYIFSIDHKVIGIQYILLALVSVFVGMFLSVLMRLRLTWSEQAWPGLATLFPLGAKGGVMLPEFYLSLVTMHGTMMVFFVLTTAPQGGFGNYFLPIQIGADDMAFPNLNMMSFWVTLLGFLVLVLAIFAEGTGTVAGWFSAKPSGTIGPIGGWTSYPTLSAIGARAGPGQGMGQNLWIISIAIFCVGSLLGALNFITTLINMRCRGMSLMRMPLTCWAWFTTAVLALLAFPVLLGGGILLLLDRVAETSFFIPGGLVVSDTLLTNHKGGSPILWQHLFWFFGHPEVYIAILPGMGATSHILATFARKPVFGYRAMVFAMFGIGLLGFFVWGHHMFMSGMSPYSGMAFSILTLSIGVPSAIKTFNWLGTMWGGKIRFVSPMLYAIGFVSLFVAGGITGLVLGQTSLDLPMHDTYFVLAHFHLVMGVAAIFGMFAGISFWFPKMFGRMMSERLGKLHFWITFTGVYCIFVPMHIMGIVGMPRRYAQFTEYEFLKSLHPLVVFVTIAVIVTAITQLVFLFNFIWSMFKGEKAGDNPWEATSLEWAIPSPPPHDNFAGIPPVVYRGPYEYSVPGAPDDFIMQTEPDPTEAGGSAHGARDSVAGRGTGNGHNGHKH
ncbi:MAG TPA: cbb3-type cytochrome c oxidase subunit I [Pyrinomonadaceae bacterium]|jgi:cytochrome c oxidase subunit 1|nr:cbb3-type cytochrome c oxidase subunit I [Pyrinomonadaceae bacterium]